MTEDVGTTKRKPLTPRQRLKLFEDHGGRCAICGQKIMGSFIDEHIIPLGLGGTNDLSNRAPVHVACAQSKTFGQQGDNAKIAKAKRQKMKSLGIERQKVKIKSRGFLTSRKEPRIEKAVLPPRNIYE
jgi:5-methylcytosine-specific restriction endonuclease McrA